MVSEKVQNQVGSTWLLEMELLRDGNGRFRSQSASVYEVSGGERELTAGDFGRDGSRNGLVAKGNE